MIVIRAAVLFDLYTEFFFEMYVMYDDVDFAGAKQVTFSTTVDCNFHFNRRCCCWCYLFFFFVVAFRLSIKRFD